MIAYFSEFPTQGIVTVLLWLILSISNILYAWHVRFELRTMKLNHYPDAHLSDTALGPVLLRTRWLGQSERPS